MSHRTHGTYVKYVVDRCRCVPCRQANSVYERARTQNVVPAYVSATEARNHVIELRTHSVGLKIIARTSGVAHGTLSKLIYGDRTRGMAPSKRIRQSTAEKILAVTPAAATGGARIDAQPTRTLLNTMIAAGIPKSTIAVALGATGPGLQIGRRSTVTATTARDVRQLHYDWCAGRWVPVRRDCWGNTTTITPPPPPPFRPGADITELLLDLADIVETRRDQAEWRKVAACRNRPVHIWFPARGDAQTSAAAVKVCMSCIVRAQCRAANLDQPDGVYAALSGKARRSLRAQDAAA